MAVTLRGFPLEFVLGEDGDRVETSAVVLDPDGDLDPWAIVVWWSPVIRCWLATVTAADGTPGVQDAPAREGEDVFDNLVGARPRGALTIKTRDGTEPGREAFADGSALLLYFPDGLEAVVADAAGENVTSTLPAA